MKVFLKQALTNCLPGKFIHRFNVDEGIILFETAKINIEPITSTIFFCSPFVLCFKYASLPKRRTTTNHMLSRYKEHNIYKHCCWPDKQAKATLVATIFPLFTELPVTSFSVLFTASTFKRTLQTYIYVPPENNNL